MANKYEEIYKMRVSDYTCYDRLAIHGILDLLQDIASKHAITFNMSYEDLKQTNNIWVITSVKYKVIKEAYLYLDAKVVTWPKPKGLVDFERVSQIFDAKTNELLVNGSTKWIILDSNTRKIIPAKHIDYKVQTCNEDVFNNEKFIRLKDFDITTCNTYTYKASYLDLDHNNHVNNIKYGVMILNAIRLNQDEYIDTFQIDFVNETHENDEITLYYNKIENVYNIKALCNNKTVFISKIIIKENNC